MTKEAFEENSLILLDVGKEFVKFGIWCAGAAVVLSAVVGAGYAVKQYMEPTHPTTQPVAPQAPTPKPAP